MKLRKCAQAKLETFPVKKSSQAQHAERTRATDWKAAKSLKIFRAQRGLLLKRHVFAAYCMKPLCRLLRGGQSGSAAASRHADEGIELSHTPRGVPKKLVKPPAETERTAGTMLEGFSSSYRPPKKRHWQERQKTRDPVSPKGHMVDNVKLDIAK